MKVSGSFRRTTWKFPRSVEVEVSIVGGSGSFHLLPSTTASTKMFRESFHELPYTPTCIHLLLPRVPQSSSCFHRTFITIHRLPLDLLPWKPSMGVGISMGVDGNFHGRKYTSMEVNLLPWNLPWKSMKKQVCIHGNFYVPEVWGSRLTSLEVSGSFRGSTWKFLLSVEVEASITSINCSFHECIP